MQKVVQKLYKRNSLVATSAYNGEDDVARFDSLENGDGFGVRETDEGLVVDG